MCATPKGAGWLGGRGELQQKRLRGLALIARRFDPGFYEDDVSGDSDSAALLLDVVCAGDGESRASMRGR